MRRCFDCRWHNKSRHLDFYQFEYYDLINDLQLHINEVMTPKWHFAATAGAEPDAKPLWAIFLQTVGTYAWGSNVWQHPDTGAPATVILPPIPEEKGE